MSLATSASECSSSRFCLHSSTVRSSASDSPLRNGTDFGPGVGPRAAGRRSLVTWRSVSWLHVTALALRVGDMARR